MSKKACGGEMKLTNKQLIIIVIGILIVIAVAALAYFGLGGSNNTTTAEMPENFTTIALTDGITINVPETNNSTFLSDEENGIVIYNDNQTNVNIMYSTHDLELNLSNGTIENGIPIYQNGSSYIIVAKNDTFSILISTNNKDLTLKIYESINYTSSDAESNNNVVRPQQTSLDESEVMQAIFFSYLAGYFNGVSDSNGNTIYDDGSYVDENGVLCAEGETFNGAGVGLEVLDDYDSGYDYDSDDYVNYGDDYYYEEEY